MDLEDNETAMNSFDGQVEELKGTIESLEAQLAQNQIQMSDMEAMLEESKAQVEDFLFLCGPQHLTVFLLSLKFECVPLLPHLFNCVKFNKAGIIFTSSCSHP